MISLLHLLLASCLSRTFSFQLSCLKTKFYQKSVRVAAYNLPELRKTDWKTAAAIGVVSAPLGTMLDNYHGLFGVLTYNSAISAVSLSWPGTEDVILKTSAWTPFLFAYAGAAMSMLLFFTESLANNELKVQARPRVMYGISLFSLQYYLSGLLDSLETPGPFIHVVLALIAAVGMIFGEFLTVPGIVLALGTAVAGPLVEVILVNYFHLYTYTNADLLGVCSWILWVYLLGGPAVGNLALVVREVYRYQESNSD